MAICYHCGERFRGEECTNCGEEPRYFCWNCKLEIDINFTHECTLCGWYMCPSCESCGCNTDDRPRSLQEKEDEQEPNIKNREDIRSYIQ